MSEVFLKKIISENFLRKALIRESDLSKDAPATLLKSLSVMVDFLEIFQELNKNSFQHKKHYREIVSQARYEGCRYVDGGCVSFL